MVSGLQVKTREEATKHMFPEYVFEQRDQRLIIDITRKERQEALGSLSIHTTNINMYMYLHVIVWNKKRAMLQQQQ